jgi:hypothetical protein
MTLSAAFQTLGLSLLLLQVFRRRGVSSVSVRTLYLYALVLCFRLYATSLYQGYRPVDRSGDYLYQLIEGVSLVIVAVTICKMKMGHVDDYPANDTCNALALVALAAICAYLVHPNLNEEYAPDVSWTFALYLESVAMLPQLFLLTKLGGEIESSQGHYMACTFVSRALMLRFWLKCYAEISGHRTKKDEEPIKLAGLGVIGSQVLQLVLLADFMYIYVKNLRSSRKLVLSYSI